MPSPQPARLAAPAIQPPPAAGVPGTWARLYDLMAEDYFGFVKSHPEHGTLQ